MSDATLLPLDKFSFEAQKILRNRRITSLELLQMFTMRQLGKGKARAEIKQYLQDQKKRLRRHTESAEKRAEAIFGSVEALPVEYLAQRGTYFETLLHKWRPQKWHTVGDLLKPENVSQDWTLSDQARVRHHLSH